MYSTNVSAILRRNLFPAAQHFKPLAAFWRSQQTQAEHLDSNETFRDSAKPAEIEDSGVRPFEEIPGPKKNLKSMVELYVTTEGFVKGYKMNDLMFAKHGPIYKEEFSGRPVVHIMDPDDFQIVFRADGKYPQRADVFGIWLDHRKRRNLSPGIFLANGEEWYRLRHSISQKIMRPKIVEENFDNFNAVVDDAIAKFVKLKEACGPDDHIPDVEGELCRWSIESIITLAFDTRIGLYEDPPKDEALKMSELIREHLDLSQKLIFNIVSRFASQYIETPTLKKFYKCADASFDMGLALIDKKMRELKEMEEKGILASGDNQVVSVLKYLLLKTELPLGDINGVALDILGAGVHTAPFSILWLLYNLGRFPHIQEKVYQEIESVLGKDKDVTARTIAKLPYLKACLKESMRLTPVTGFNMRMLEQDVVLSGYNVPAQTFIFLHEYCTARSEKYFEDPLEFKPERWLRENKDQIHAFSSHPFGVGVRMCIGRRVAELEMHLFLCKFLHRFRVEYNHEPLVPLQKLLMSPDKPVKIKLFDRL